jgi:hypothetical protein
MTRNDAMTNILAGNSKIVIRVVAQTDLLPFPFYPLARYSGRGLG